MSYKSFGLVLLGILFVSAPSALAANLHVVNSPTNAGYASDILKAADRLIVLQGTDGAWDWQVTNATGPSGTTYYNVVGATAEGLLDAYTLSKNQKYLSAAEKAGDYLMAASSTLATTRQNAFNIVFLQNLATASNNSSYSDLASTMLNTVLGQSNYWTTNNGSYCSVTGCTADQLLSAYENYRGAPTTTPDGVIAWDLEPYVAAASAAGNATFASALQQSIQGYLNDSGFASTSPDYDLGLSSAIRAAKVVNADYSALQSALVASQQGDGGFGLPGDGRDQVTSYALMAFNAIGDSAHAALAAQYLKTNFGYSSIDGWQDTDGSEYAETDGESITAITGLLPKDTFYSIGDAMGAVSDNDTITLDSDATVTAEVTITRPLTIDGAGHTLFAPIDNSANSTSNNAGLGIVGVNGPVTVENLTVDGTASKKVHGINIFESKDVILDDVTAQNNSKAGITINGSAVTISNITTSGNSWGGINADQAADAPDPTVVNIAGISTHTESGPQMWVDDNTRNVTVNDTNAQYATTTYTHDTSIVGTLYQLSTKNIKTASVTHDASTGDVAVTVDIPSGAVVKGDSTWDGTITPPVATTTSVTISGFNTTVTSAIAVGSSDSDLIFSRAAKLTFAGQAGKLVGWYNHAGQFSEITATCSSNDQATGDALASGTACKIDAGSDLVVWTKHFSTFTTYTQSPIVFGSSSVAASSGGSGGGSIAATPAVAAAPTVTPATPAAPATPAQGKVLGAATYNFTKDLHMGSAGTDVTELQKLLIASGFDIPAITKGGMAYGTFGGQTLSAVIAYQKAHGLSPARGYVSTLTRAELNKGTATSTATTTPTGKTNLTASQANAIITMVQAFGADASTVAQVKAALGQ